MHRRNGSIFKVVMYSGRRRTRALIVPSENLLGSSRTPEGSKVLQAGPEVGSYGPGVTRCVTAGVAWNSQGFLDASLSVGHPFELDGTEDDIAEAIFWVIARGPSKTRQFIRSRVSQWRKWAQDLAEQEDSLRELMNPRVRRALRSKTILLLMKFHSRGPP